MGSNIKFGALSDSGLSPEEVSDGILIGDNESELSCLEFLNPAGTC